MTYEPAIGLEVHVQLKTESKLFCGNATRFGDPPNTNVCPVCLGLPGALPVLNAAAVRLAVRAALGLNCGVHTSSVFARKNYFYPDLPKAYQITQYDQPLATGGWLEVAASRSEPQRRVRIRRIHMEEDAGKSLHDRLAGRTAIDLNRAGVPLIEIVTEPDITSPAHARAFLNLLKQTLQYLDVSDCDMEKGSLRVDANISIRPAGTTQLGTKTEVKNMNSFANVERALAFEVERQRALLAEGAPVEQETLLWDATRGEARPMRSKEESEDYRYFPDPDLPVLVVSTADINATRTQLPELPQQRAQRFRERYNIPEYDAEVLTADRAVADYYEAVVAVAGDAKIASNWIMTDVLSALNQRQIGIAELPVSAASLGELIARVRTGQVNTSLARQIFARMLSTGASADEVMTSQGLTQVSDTTVLDAWARELVQQHPAEAQRFRSGESKMLGFFMGLLMKKSKGTADPKLAQQALSNALQAGAQLTGESGG